MGDADAHGLAGDRVHPVDSWRVVWGELPPIGSCACRASPDWRASSAATFSRASAHCALDGDLLRAIAGATG